MASIEGTLTSTVGSEQTLAAFTGGEKASWTLYIDTANMADGDEIAITLSMQVISGGSESVVLYDTVSFSDISNNDTILVTIPVVLEEGYTFTASFEQLTGTSRDYNWRLADVPISS